MEGYERWPGYLDDGPRVRTLALLDEHRLLTLAGDVYTVDSWTTMKAAAFAGMLEVYVTDIAGAWWFLEALSDPQVKIMLPSSIMLHTANPITCLSVQEGRKRVWIISSRAWGVATASRDFIRLLDTFFTLAGTGVRPTPGSVGQARMRAHWRDEHRRFVSRPPTAARRTLLANSVGGRVDYFVSPLDQFTTVFETDLSGAYSSVCDRLPDGRCIGLLAEPGLDCASFYMLCTVRIGLDSPHVPFGIFGIPGEKGNEYPTHPGEYTAWLWKEEVDLCRRNGWLVMPHRGWGWEKWNSGLKSWAHAMYSLRTMAASLDSQLAAWAKQAVVAGLGRFGMPLWQWSLISETSDLVMPGDIGLTLGGKETGYALHRTREWHSNHLTHWFSFVLMRCRLVLRARMQYEYDRGNTVLMTNYDSLHCLLPADPLSLGHDLGLWKQKQLTSVRFPYPRGVLSAEKTTLPGRKRA